MIKTFRLPVGPDQDIAVIYQRPDIAPEPAAPKPAVKKHKVLGASRPPARPKKPKKRPGRPVVVMLHGFPGGHKAGPDDLFGELEYRLEQTGWPSIRFDFRGCGESDGTTGDFTLESALEDLKAVLHWARAEGGHERAILMGESCGGTVAVMGHDPSMVKALILLWPALILRETDFSEIFTRENLLAAQERDAPFIDFRGQRLGIHFVNEIYQTDLRHPLEKINVPVLIQHGTADAEVPIAQAYYARDHIPAHVDIGVFEGGDHGLRAPNMRRVLYTNIAYFLAETLKKLDLEEES